MIGIVAEFNPYHNGHKYLIEQARLELGDEPIVVCMSGDFVQRGEPAIRDKFERSRYTDADIIIELPLPWSISSADGFARGSVGLLKEFGCNYLAFGSECGNVDLLDFKDDYDAIAQYMSNHPEASWPAARSAVIGNDILDFPNNTLGHEYLKYSGNMIPFTVKRNTVHDGKGSAKEIRSNMIGPDLECQIISRLKMFDKDYYNTLQGSSNGIGNRLYEAVGESNSLEEIYKLAKTKRITESSIRRLTCCAYLGITEGMNSGVPEYARILYFNDRGQKVLKGKFDLPIITKPSDIKKLGKTSADVFAVGASAHDFYLLGFPQNSHEKRGKDYRTGPFIVNNAQ